MTFYLRAVLLLALGQLACQHHVVFEEIAPVKLHDSHQLPTSKKEDFEGF